MNLISIGTLFVLVYVISINCSYSGNTHSGGSISSSWITSLAFGEDDSSNFPAEYSVYVNDKHGFTLEYPTYWSYEEGEWSNTVNGMDLLVLNSNDDTRIIFAKKVDDVEFRNLQEQSYLNKMMKNEEDFCRMLTMDEYYWTCSNFEPTLSTVIPDPKYPAYVVSYTYTAEFNDGTSEKYSTSKLQIPDRGNTWRIIVDEPEAKMLNHPEEIASILNSFTILEENKNENISNEDIESWFDYIIDGGEILSITPDVEAHSLIIAITTSQDGSLEITLPRTLIDATMEDQDDRFFVLVDGWEVDFEETKTSTDRTLTIQFPAGAEEIEIMGTFVVPEFGSIIMIVMALGFFGIIFARFQKIIFKA